MKYAIGMEGGWVNSFALNRKRWIIGFVKFLLYRDKYKLSSDTKKLFGRLNLILF